MIMLRPYLSAVSHVTLVVQSSKLDDVLQEIGEQEDTGAKV